MRPAALLAAAFVLAASALPAPAASTYSQATWGEPWDTLTLDILIVPPEHGQLVNDNGVMNRYDVDEVGPFNNSYLRAIERGISNWRRAIRLWAPRYLSSRLRINSYVLGRDDVPLGALRDPEGLIMTAPHQGEAIGLTVQGRDIEKRCVISNARFFTASFTYEDMLNVGTHEFGHCLGLDHVNAPKRDILSPIYRHTPGASRNPHVCPSTLNVKAVTRAFGGMFGRSATGTVKIARTDYRQLNC